MSDKTVIVGGVFETDAAPPEPVEHSDTDILPIGGPRDVLVNLVLRALRSEAGVRHKQLLHQPSGFYAGRRAGFVASAATLATMLFGTDYEQAKSLLSNRVKVAGDQRPIEDLRDEAKSGGLADEIVDRLLSAELAV